MMNENEIEIDDYYQDKSNSQKTPSVPSHPSSGSPDEHDEFYNTKKGMTANRLLELEDQADLDNEHVE